MGRRIGSGEASGGIAAAKEGEGNCGVVGGGLWMKLEEQQREINELGK